ncbi:MAG: hypothetical protein K6G10_09370 [Butyrivibrio sp.]|nr:hypothetical protein [Butyrivibrio sp.]
MITIFQGLEKCIKRGRVAVVTVAVLGMLAVSAAGCGKDAGEKEEAVKVAAYDAGTYVRMSDLTSAGEDPELAASGYEPIHNFDTKLSVPTCITKIDDTWFIVDCYHNRVIYSKELGIPLDQWYIMSAEATQPHTIASDGVVYMIEDTENNRVLVYEKIGDKFIGTQVFYGIGTRPHFTVYDKGTDTFYVWSSETGELYCFRHTKDSGRMYLTEIKKIESLDGIYVRSFSIIDGDIYFVSGVSGAGTKPQILQCDLTDLSVKKTYAVPAELAGMVQIERFEGDYYITVSTDMYGDQSHATFLKTPSLEELSKGNYEDIYSSHFVGGGTPYYITEIDGTCFLTEHRLTDHAIWSFKIDDGKITDETTLY